MIRRCCAAMLLVAVLFPCPCAAASAIRRDTYGVPHILADTEPEAAFLHGYAAAEDHLELMARLYLRAQSRQSEFFGAASLEDDFFFKQLQIQEKAAHALASLPPLMRHIVERYAEGYNAFLARAGARRPAYAQPIRAVDVVAHCYAVLLSDFSIATRPERLPADRPSPASNMWMLGGAKTESGRGILLANPHLRWEDAFTFHEVHLRVPGQIDIYGVAFVGSPVVGIGFNAMLGWSHTVNQVDASDIYRLTLDVTKTSYRFDDKWRPLRSTTVTLKVRTDEGLRDESRVLWWSHHGPVLRVSGTTGYALKTAIGDEGLFLLQWHDMAKAKSLAEFQAALDIQGLPMFNVGYADRDGHIYFLAGGRVPVRPSGYEWSGIVPGDTSRTEWSVLHPNRELPQKLDPKSGYLQNSNEPPWFVNRREPIPPEGYAKYMTAGVMSARAQISQDLLEARPRFTLDAVVSAKFNARSLVAAGVKPDLVAALRAEHDEHLDAAAAILTGWNDSMDADSRGAVLFNIWWEDYSRKAKPALSGPPSIPRLADHVQAVQSLRIAIDQLAKRGAALDTAWGDVYRLQRGVMDLPMSGCAFALACFRAMQFRPGANGRQAAYYGDTFIMAVEFGQTPRAYGVLAYSQSSNPASPHFNDQARLFASSRLREIWFTEAQIAANQESTFRPDSERSATR